MMATTHMVTGMLIALPVVLLAPELAVVALLAGLLGGLFPDLDLYFNHRKTLHFPVGYPVVAGIAIVLAMGVPSLWTVSVAIAFTAAAVHSVMDVFGGGLELEPWRATSDRGVYSHVHGRWLRPRRWIPYDGSPADLGLAIVVAIPLFVAMDGGLQSLLVGLLGISVVYTLLRRWLAEIAQKLAGFVPPSLQAYVPERYLAQP